MSDAVHAQGCWAKKREWWRVRPSQLLPGSYLMCAGCRRLIEEPAGPVRTEDGMTEPVLIVDLEVGDRLWLPVGGSAEGERVEVTDVDVVNGVVSVLVDGTRAVTLVRRGPWWRRYSRDR